MTYKEWNILQEMAVEGDINDELNPAFLLHNVCTDLLVDVANGKIDCQKLAKIMLADQGKTPDGKYVGCRTAIKQIINGEKK